jgi:hypothetical protein
MVEPEVRAFRRLEALTHRWKAGRRGVAAAMDEALGEFRRIRARGPWASLARLDWNAGRDAFARWLHEELDAYPPPARVKGLWFNAPEMESGEPQTWVIGSASFGTGSNSFEWAAREVWPPEAAFEKARRRRGVALDVVLEPLRTAQGRLALSESSQDGENLDRHQFLFYTLPLAYTSALLIDVLPMIWPRLLLGKVKRRGIACGFQSGDGVTLGWLTASGWVH